MNDGAMYQASRDQRRPDVTGVTATSMVLVEPTKSMIRWHKLVVNFCTRMIAMSITQRSHLSYVGSDFLDGVFKGTDLSLIVAFSNIS